MSFAKIWNVYKSAMSKHPWKTQIITSSVLFGSGDVIAQLAIEKRSLKQYDYVRSGRFFALGAYYVAPALRAWHTVLERFVKGSPAILPLKRVILDQMMYPCFLTAFLTQLRFWEGNKATDIWEKYKTDFPDIWMNALKFWPAAQLLNFYMVSVQYRPLFVQAATLLWTCYLAYRTQTMKQLDMYSLN